MAGSIGYGIPISGLEAGVARAGGFYSTDDNASIVDMELFLRWQLDPCPVGDENTELHVLLPFREPLRL